MADVLHPGRWWRMLRLRLRSRQDVRYAWRGLRRTPVYSVVAVTSLGLGLGATASLVAIVDAVLVRPLPLPDADRLVWIEEWRNDVSIGGSLQRLGDWQRIDGVAAAAGYFGDEPLVRTASSDFGRLPAARTFGPLLDVLGIVPVLGRAPTAAEQRGEGPAVALLGELTWRTRFGARPDVIGEAVRVDQTNAEIIGVLPAAADALVEAAIWTPALPAIQASGRQAGVLGQVARLKAGQSTAVVQQAFAAAAATMRRTHPTTDGALDVRLVPLRTRLGQDARTPLPLLLSTAGLVS
jgi:putative ABC transport system permease protein